MWIFPPDPLARAGAVPWRVRGALLGRRLRALPRAKRRDGPRDSRGSGGIRHRNTSDGIRHRKIRFSVLVFGTESSAFSGTGFLFPRGAGDGFRFLHRLYASPFVGRLSTADRSVGEPILARRSELAVAGLAVLRVEESERLALADAWADGVPVDAVLDEVLVRDRELAVVLAAVLGKFDLDSGEDAVTAERQHAIRGALQHRDQPAGKLAAEAVAAMIGTPAAHGSSSSASRTSSKSICASAP